MRVYQTPSLRPNEVLSCYPRPSFHCQVLVTIRLEVGVFLQVRLKFGYDCYLPSVSNPPLLGLVVL